MFERLFLYPPPLEYCSVSGVYAPWSTVVYQECIPPWSTVVYQECIPKRRSTPEVGFSLHILSGSSRQHGLTSFRIRTRIQRQTLQGFVQLYIVTFHKLHFLEMSWINRKKNYQNKKLIKYHIGANIFI